MPGIRVLGERVHADLSDKLITHISPFGVQQKPYTSRCESCEWSDELMDSDKKYPLMFVIFCMLTRKMRCVDSKYSIKSRQTAFP